MATPKYMFTNTGYFAYSAFLIYVDSHSLLQPSQAKHKELI